ncbi:hypothetical protein D9M68_303580 [compost metagenome]
MSEIAGRSVRDIAGKEVVFRELTVEQIRAMAADRAEFNLITDGLFEELSLRDIPRMCSLTDEQLESMLPSEIDEVIRLCKERNTHFFKLLARLNQQSKA